MVRKKIIMGTGWLILLLILLSVTRIFLIPKDTTQKGFPVTINGEVQTTATDYHKYPKLAYAYYPYHNLAQLGEYGESIKMATIEWKEGRGHFSMTFNLPIEMQIIITPYPAGCNYTTAYVSPEENVKEVSLFYNESVCYDKLTIPENIEELENRVKESLQYALEESKQVGKEQIVNAQKEIVDAGKVTNQEEIKMHWLTAYWLIWRAKYEDMREDLGTCYNESESIYNKAGECVIVGYELNKTIINTRNIYNASYNQWFINNDYHSVEGISELENTIRYTANQWIELNQANEECKTARDVINKSVKSQEPICEMRRYTLSFINWLQFALGILLGIILGDIIERWKKEK